MNSSVPSASPSDPDGDPAALSARLNELHRTELERWAEAVSEAKFVSEELEAMRKTLSWRVTAPLRVIRAKQLRR